MSKNILQMKRNAHSYVLSLLLLTVISSRAGSEAIIPWTNAIPTNAVLTVRCNEMERMNARVDCAVAEAQLGMARTNLVSGVQLATLQEKYDAAKKRLLKLEAELKTRGHIHEWIPTITTNLTSKN